MLVSLTFNVTSLSIQERIFNNTRGKLKQLHPSTKTLHFTKVLLFLATIQKILIPVHTISGVIWNKDKESFVPIFSIPSFSKMNQQKLTMDRQLEHHNFHGRPFTFTSPEDGNLLIFSENDTKVSGLLGEMWTALSESLNFTLRPIRTNFTGVGKIRLDDSFSGLLERLHNNEIDIVGRIEMYNKRWDAVQFTVPLWKCRHRLYIRQELKYDTYWIVKLFSQEVWYTTLIMYFILTFYSFVSQIIVKKLMHKNKVARFGEHCFYNLSMIIGQSYIPSELEGRPKIFEISIGLFSALIKTAFSALMISYMTKKVIIPPFGDVHSLFFRSSYTVVAVKDSLPHLALEYRSETVYERMEALNRFVIVPTTEEMYNMGCLTTSKYAVFDADDLKKGRGLSICPLNPVGKIYYERFVSSGLRRNFEHRKAINMGLINLYENGILKALRYRWLDSKDRKEEKNPNETEPIDIHQIYLLLTIFYIGVLMSVVVCVLENIVFRFRKMMKSTDLHC